MKRNRSVKKSWPGIAVTLFLLIGMAWSCKKAPIVYSTTNVQNITSYLEARPDSFSAFLEMLSIAGDADFLDAYGHYTLFLPTNKAVDAFLKKMNKSSVKEVDPKLITDIVEFHILQDTVYTISFTDGKLPDLTLYGQYLITGAKNNEKGQTTITVNRQANIIESNIRAGNGVIQVLDHVLQPALYSLAELIEKNPDYSIFTQALKATGLYDTLNILPAENPDSTRAWLTVLAETDSVFQAVGINSLADLKAKYSNTGDPKNVKDSLHLFMAYHILYKADYLADIISNSSFNTLAPKEVITSKMINDSILINDAVFNGVHEQGILVDRDNSDISATNGVLHKLLGNLFIKVRSPFPVYWDVCRMPEITKQPFYGKEDYGYSSDNLPGFINDEEANYFPTYVMGGDLYRYGDYLDIPIGARRTPWIEFTTPLLVRGKYKVWICMRRAGRDNINQVSIDGVSLPRTVNFGTYIPSGTEAELLAQGWKHYSDPPTDNWNGYLVGTIDIQTTGQHVLRFTNLQGTGSVRLDMIEFIPVDMNQVWPKFKTDGTPVYKP